MSYISIPNTEYQVLVDEDKAHLLNGKRLRVRQDKGYCSVTANSRNITHVLFGKPEPGMVWDHISGSTFDNRQSNIRLLPHRLNSMLKQSTKTKSKYSGVGWDKQKQLWQARITIDGVYKKLGHSKNEAKCAIMWNKALKTKLDRLGYGEYYNVIRNKV